MPVVSTSCHPRHKKIQHCIATKKILSLSLSLSLSYTKETRTKIQENNGVYSLLLVAFVVEDGERDDEEHKHGVKNVDRVPQLPHGQREATSTDEDGMLARVLIGDVSRQHENGKLRH